MKKTLFVFILSLTSMVVSAQGYQSTQIGLIKNGEDYSLVYPSSNIAVELLLEEEVVTPGIYARYAQKFLAQRAPLVAQTTITIVNATISAVSDNNHSLPLSPMAPVTEYASLPADQYSSTVLSSEYAARDAAAAIFTIRRQRRDIINGEAGEGYFGAGLDDAMARLDAMEQEYLELFMGSRTTTQRVERYVIKPQEGVNRHMIARFDSKVGILPASDLTGFPVYMQFVAQDLPDTSVIEAEKKSKAPTLMFRFAAPTECTLYNDSEVIATALLPIYQFGKNVEVKTPVANY